MFFLLEESAQAITSGKGTQKPFAVKLVSFRESICGGGGGCVTNFSATNTLQKNSALVQNLVIVPWQWSLWTLAGRCSLDSWNLWQKGHTNTRKWTNHLQHTMNMKINMYQSVHALCWWSGRLADLSLSSDFLNSSSFLAIYSVLSSFLEGVSYGAGKTGALCV